MAAQIKTVSFQGIGTLDIDVQVQISSGLPAFNIVGLPDKAVAESRERVRAALHALGLSMPPKRLTVNLAPADVAKEGAHYDLPIAMGLLVAMGVLPADGLDDFLVLGELSLDGRLSPIHGGLPAAIHAQSRGLGLILPHANGMEAAWAGDLDVYAPKHLLDILNHIKGQQVMRPVRLSAEMVEEGPKPAYPCMSDVKGQESAKRALEIAAAGGHNILLVGPPGSGKSMLAERLPGILPPLSAAEALDVSMIHSLSGSLPESGLVRQRPYRDPHHSASLPALVGGGHKVKPGEISLAHRGVLFLDELPEFSRATLEALRQPLESGKTLIARANHHVSYPARFQLVGAMNPCRCGYLGDQSRECTKAPKCGLDYQAKLSGPILDRIDMRIEVPAVSLSDLSQGTKSGETSAQIAARVCAAREVQQRRIEKAGLDTKTISCNAHLPAASLEELIPLSEEAQSLVQRSAEKFALSARGYHRLLRVARTIADLAGDTGKAPLHERFIAEALAYR